MRLVCVVLVAVSFGLFLYCESVKVSRPGHLLLGGLESKLFPRRDLLLKFSFKKIWMCWRCRGKHHAPRPMRIVGSPIPSPTASAMISVGSSPASSSLPALGVADDIWVDIDCCDPFSVKDGA